MKLFNSLTNAALAASLLILSPSLFAAKDADVTGSLTMQNSDFFSRSAEPGGSLEVRYGDEVAFEVAIEGRVAKKSRIYVTVVCRQPDVVFQASNWTDYTFTMTDLAGQGLVWDGSAADCTASLIYRVDKGRQVVHTILDDVPFAVN